MIEPEETPDILEEDISSDDAPVVEEPATVDEEEEDGVGSEMPDKDPSSENEADSDVSIDNKVEKVNEQIISGRDTLIDNRKFEVSDKPVYPKLVSSKALANYKPKYGIGCSYSEIITQLKEQRLIVINCADDQVLTDLSNQIEVLLKTDKTVNYDLSVKPKQGGCWGLDDFMNELILGESAGSKNLLIKVSDPADEFQFGHEINHFFESLFLTGNVAGNYKDRLNTRNIYFIYLTHFQDAQERIESRYGQWNFEHYQFDFLSIHLRTNFEADSERASLLEQRLKLVRYKVDRLNNDYAFCQKVLACLAKSNLEEFLQELEGGAEIEEVSKVSEIPNLTKVTDLGRAILFVVTFYTEIPVIHLFSMVKYVLTGDIDKEDERVETTRNAEKQFDTIVNDLVFLEYKLKEGVRTLLFRERSDERHAKDAFMSEIPTYTINKASLLLKNEQHFKPEFPDAIRSGLVNVLYASAQLSPEKFGYDLVKTWADANLINEERRLDSERQIRELDKMINLLTGYIELLEQHREEKLEEVLQQAAAALATGQKFEWDEADILDAINKVKLKVDDAEVKVNHQKLINDFKRLINECLHGKKQLEEQRDSLYKLRTLYTGLLEQLTQLFSEDQYLTREVVLRSLNYLSDDSRYHIIYSLFVQVLFSSNRVNVLELSYEYLKNGTEEQAQAAITSLMRVIVFNPSRMFEIFSEVRSWTNDSKIDSNLGSGSMVLIIIYLYFIRINRDEMREWPSKYPVFAVLADDLETAKEQLKELTAWLFDNRMASAYYHFVLRKQGEKRNVAQNEVSELLTSVRLHIIEEWLKVLTVLEVNNIPEEQSRLLEVVLDEMNERLNSHEKRLFLKSISRKSKSYNYQILGHKQNGESRLEIDYMKKKRAAIRFLKEKIKNSQ